MITEFTWDDEKSERCLRERGFSFADVIPAFADPGRHVEIDDRWEYGEARYRLYGRVAGRMFVIVYARRGCDRSDHLRPQGECTRKEAS